jgi:hypothetical protein
VYGLALPLFEPVHDRLRARAPLARAAAYGAGALAVEYTCGRLLRTLVGRAPWDYGDARFGIHGLARLDYLPLWGAYGLGLERVHDALVAPRIGSRGHRIGLQRLLHSARRSRLRHVESHDRPTTADLLGRERAAIVSDAEAALARAHSRHYESAGEDAVRQRLEALYDHLVEAVGERDLGPMLAYAERIAEERFNAGYDLAEVQTAFNALEEATWSRVFAELEPSQLAESLGLVSTVLGAAKDALGRRYVSLATNAHAPSLDLQALFAGTEGA